MDDSLSATEAKRTLRRLLRNVRHGCTYVVTSRGKAIARIIPVAQQPSEAARTALLARLQRQPLVETAPWTRDELYEEQG